MEIFSPLHPLRVKRLKNHIEHIPNLWAYYPLWEDSGTVAHNRAPTSPTGGSPSVYNGTVTDALLGQRGGSYTRQLGAAAEFDGTGDIITLPILDNFFTSDILTVGCLAARNGTQSVSDQILNYRTDDTHDGFTIQLGAGGTSWSAEIRNGATNTASFVVAGNDLQFTLLVLCYQENLARFYVNGAQVGADDTSCVMSAANSVLAVGAEGSNPTTHGFAGRVQHVFVIHDFLSTAQILRIARIAGVA